MKKLENPSSKTLKITDKKHFVDAETLKLQMENDVLKKELSWYKEQYELSKKNRFGSSSEKMPHEDQIGFFNEAEMTADTEATETDVTEVVYNRSVKKSSMKDKLDDLPVERIEYTLSEADQACPVCDHDLHQMSTQIRRELKVVPASVTVVEHVQSIYSCRSCEVNEEHASIIKAAMPNPVLAKSMVSPTLLAHIMNNKFTLGIPLYRQEKEFKRTMIPISRQNLANWVLHGANEHLVHLYDHLHKHLVTKDVLHADETDIQVLEEDGRTSQQKSKMWVYASSHTDEMVCLYDYRTTRAGKHAVNFLKGFSGYLHTDGYTGYNQVPNTTIMACVAHVRRYFHEAMVAVKDVESPRHVKAKEGLAFCTKLFNQEKRWKELIPEDRYIKRQDEMKPVLDAYLVWLKEMKKAALPKSKLGDAVRYTLNLWPKVITILEDGRLELSNNRAERLVKPFVINRKNFLFSKTPMGAQSSAIVQSIVETAKGNNLNVFYYLTYLLEQLPNIDVGDPEQLDQLLPWSDKLPEHLKLKN